MKTITLPVSTVTAVRRALTKAIKAIDLEGKLDDTKNSQIGCAENEKERAEIDAVNACREMLNKL